MTQTTELTRSTRKDVLICIALIAVAILSVVLYLWISFSPRRDSELPERPWDLELTAGLPLTDDDLAAIRALDGVERVEQSGTAKVLHIWASDRDAAEEQLAALAAAREAERVQALLRAAAEPDAAALTELAEARQELDARAGELAQTREKLDRDQAALREREAQLNNVRTELNRDGHDLDEDEVQLSVGGAEAYGESIRIHNRQRDAWYAGGEEYLDALTRYEQARQQSDRDEEAYAAAMAAYEADSRALDERRKALEQTETAISEIGDDTWQLAQNPDAAAYAAQLPFSPLRLAMQTLCLAVAAMAVWFLFARLLSAAAGSIVKPSPEAENAGEQACPDEPLPAGEEAAETAALK